MDIDTNWCLNCDCHFEGTGPYCSPLCYGRDDQAMYHNILAWAADIPPPHSTTLTHPNASTSRLPKLLRPNQRPAPPALCVTSPRPALPSPARPILMHSPPESTSESSLATPASIASFLGVITTHVRSWVAPSPNEPHHFTIIAHPSKDSLPPRPRARIMSPPP
ncbi:hypothetical protein D9615_003691 [Tricholomella constricta]|uniref:Uncharacterized protein n=1 Tax=Tricholomella constricta TaxID=117010 RepID=A0A8H5HIG8_9AGAR|nr:hypothetical protein D9615_003691 [Tricholomella constricta]